MWCVMLALVLLLPGCAGAPRVSTEEERAIADQMLTTIETAIVVAAAAGALKPEQQLLALGQVSQLRALVLRSGSDPVGWANLMQIGRAHV